MKVTPPRSADTQRAEHHLGCRVQVVCFFEDTGDSGVLFPLIIYIREPNFIGIILANIELNAYFCNRKEAFMGVYENNIIPIKISHLAAYISKVKRISLDDALVYIYVNPMYERLYDEEAKWWYLSTEALYEEFELRRNRQNRNVPKEVFEFYTYCLENYAIRKQMSGMSAWVIFKESSADEYVIDNYDLLHTQGLEYVLDDIQRFINRRKR